jgi:hypothetical protein
LCPILPPTTDIPYRAAAAADGDGDGPPPVTPPVPDPEDPPVSAPFFSARTAPAVVTASFWLWIASTVISLLSFFVTLPAVLGADGAGTAFAGGIIAATLVGALFGAAVRVACALFLLRGAAWARIVLTALGALLLFGLVPSVIAGDLVSLLILLLVVAAAVLMWLPAARPHFRRS